MTVGIAFLAGMLTASALGLAGVVCLLRMQGDTRPVNYDRGPVR